MRVVPILLSMLATFTLLFGGWFLYQKMQVEEPLRNHITQLKSAELAALQVNKDQVRVVLRVINPEAFSLEYSQLMEELKQIAPNKQVTVETSNRAPELEAIWQDGIFALTEAVELHQYSKIPALMHNWQQMYQLDKAKAAMDEKHVFIYLQRGDDDFFKVVPRQVADGEVTSHG
ncbi:MAG: hypothetical protein H0Z34_04440 [Brevibacillus sp.]|nr:hypothetical protein [Brevibacillus sp.]